MKLQWVVMILINWTTVSRNSAQRRAISMGSDLLTMWRDLFSHDADYWYKTIRVSLKKIILVVPGYTQRLYAPFSQTMLLPNPPTVIFKTSISLSFKSHNGHAKREFSYQNEGSKKFHILPYFRKTKPWIRRTKIASPSSVPTKQMWPNNARYHLSPNRMRLIRISTTPFNKKSNISNSGPPKPKPPSMQYLGTPDWLKRSPDKVVRLYTKMCIIS